LRNGGKIRVIKKGRNDHYGTGLGLGVSQGKHGKGYLDLRELKKKKSANPERDKGGE